MAKKIIRLTENDLANLIKKVIEEQEEMVGPQQPSQTTPMTTTPQTKTTMKTNANPTTTAKRNYSESPVLGKILIGSEQAHFDIHKITKKETGCEVNGKYRGGNQDKFFYPCFTNFLVKNNDYSNTNKYKLNSGTANSGKEQLTKLCGCGPAGGYGSTEPQGGFDQTTA